MAFGVEVGPCEYFFCGSLTAADLGIPQVYTDGLGIEWNFQDMTGNCVRTDMVQTSAWTGTCEPANAFHDESLWTEADCLASQCDEATGGGGAGYDCAGYDDHDLSVRRNSATVYSVGISETWVSGMWDHPSQLAVCDDGWYDWVAGGFSDLGPGTLLYGTGIRDGDVLVEAYQHDPVTYQQIGSVYALTTFDKAIDAMQLLPAPGADGHVTLKVKRGTTTITFRFDST